MKLAVGFDTSGAEELQKKVPRAQVVKCFNTAFAKQMDSGKVGGQPLSAFAAGNDAGAKAVVLGLARDIGFDPVDSGPLENARLLEPLALLNIRLAFVEKLGPEIGFKLLHP
jgi:predicted dinucleotide-binding enzyme